MEETSIIISGFGGQGTLFAGQVLAYASMDNGLEVTWIPSYGPEMRGGTAHCTVIVSEEAIGSPLVRYPDVVLALNLPSVDKYEYLVPDDGVLIANSSLFNREIERKSIQSLLIPANEIAEELGMVRLANLSYPWTLLRKHSKNISRQDIKRPCRSILMLWIAGMPSPNNKVYH